MSKSLYAGFDLGGTNLKYGLVDEGDMVVLQDTVPTPDTVDELFELIGKLWRRLKDSGKGTPAAAGFGFPGIFSLKDRKILQSPNYQELDDLDLTAALSRAVDAPFWVDNDANMAAYGEWACGSGRGAASLVLLTIGTGIGSGIILDGDLWHGACGYAGELGHITVNPDGEPCKCGSRGCLETEAAAPRIVQNYLDLSKAVDGVSAKEVYEKAAGGDVAAVKAFSIAGRYLGIGLGSVINFLNPEKIILGGGVMTTGDFLLPAAVEEARKRSYRASFACCSIEKAGLGNTAGLMGSACWARRQHSRSDRP